MRQVLEQELHRTILQRENAARQARLKAGGGVVDLAMLEDKENQRQGGKEKDVEVDMGSVKRDFFGRVIVESTPLSEVDGNAKKRKEEGERHKVWVTYHEGLNNAVKKPISLEEFLRGL